MVKKDDRKIKYKYKKIFLLILIVGTFLFSVEVFAFPMPSFLTPFFQFVDESIMGDFSEEDNQNLTNLTTTYTASTKTVCNTTSRECTKTLYSNTIASKKDESYWHHEYNFVNDSILINGTWEINEYWLNESYFDENITYYPFAELTNVKWENGGFNISYNDKYWILLVPYVIYEGTEYTMQQIHNAYPNVVLTDYIKPQMFEHKFALNYSNIPQNLLDGLDYILLKVEDTNGLTLEDIVKTDNYSYVIKNKVKVSYTDLIENGYTAFITNRTLYIGNLSDNYINGVLSLDPTIVLQDANTENLDDTYLSKDDNTDTSGSSSTLQFAISGDVEQKNQIYKWTLSALPSGIDILNANASLYVGSSNTLDVVTEGFNVTAYLVWDNYTVDGVQWIEGIGSCDQPGEICWDERPNTSHFIIPSETFVDFWGGASEPISQWEEWEVTSILQYAVDNSYENVSLYFNASGLFGSPGTTDYVQIVSKEGGTASQRPILTITYLYTPPRMSYVDPTPADESTQSLGIVEINLSIDTDNLQEVIFNWNGTNYTLFNESLIAYWNFNNVGDLGENATYILDLSFGDKNRNLTNFNLSAAYPVTEGRYAGSFNFTNEPTGLLRTTVEAYSAPLTYVAWVKLPDLNSHADIISQGNSGTLYHHITMTVLTDSRLRCQHSSHINNLQYGYAGGVSANEWHFVACIFPNNTRRQAYVDGTMGVPEEGASSGVPQRTNLWVGRQTRGPGNPFQGLVDDVMVFNRSLTEAELDQLYFMNLQKYNSTRWYLYVNQSLTNDTVLPDDTYTYFASANGIYSGLNMTKIRSITIGTADSCTYSSGNWVVDCADACYVESSVEVDGSSVYLTGTGTFTIANNVYITNYDYIFHRETCKLQLFGDGGFK